MKKIVLIIFSMATLFIFMATALPCYAGKKKEGLEAQQPIVSGDVIYGCYKKVNGQLRIVKGPDNCRPSEELISWETTGQAGGIDLSKTEVKKCENMADCLCENNGWVLHGYAECPQNAVLVGVGTPVDGTDYGFHAKCMSLDGTPVDPAFISIRCMATSLETNCTDGIDNDGDGLVDCSDSDCTADPACQPVPVENCTDGIDNDGDGLVDCSDSDCTADPACQPVPVENCTDGIDNDGDGLVDCSDSDCTADPACQPGFLLSLVEICSDGIDNDGDGAIDCKDRDCAGDQACTKKKKPKK